MNLFLNLNSTLYIAKNDLTSIQCSIYLIYINRNSLTLYLSHYQGSLKKEQLQKYQNYLHILLLYCILLTRLFDRIKASKKWFRKKVSEKLGMSLFVKCPCLLVKCTTQLFLSFFPPSTFWMASRSSWDAINSFKLSLATTFKWMSTWKETQRKNKRENF